MIWKLVQTSEYFSFKKKYEKQNFLFSNSSTAKERLSLLLAREQSSLKYIIGLGEI